MDRSPFRPQCLTPPAGSPRIDASGICAPSEVFVRLQLPPFEGMTVNDSDTPKPKHRWYQFSLRMLVVVMLLGISGCGPGKGQQAIDAYNRGVDHDDQGEFDKAIADYTEAIRLRPDEAGVC